MKPKKKSESSARAVRRTGNARRTKKAKSSSAEPSKASLREIPELDLSKVKLRRNPYAARIARDGMTVQSGRGRPKKVLEVGVTYPRSVRFPKPVWDEIEALAKQQGKTVHAVLREAVLTWIKRA